jgi:itaconate CoA-transferase
MLGLQNEREWKVFCDVLLQTRRWPPTHALTCNAQRNANREALRH